MPLNLSNRDQNSGHLFYNRRLRAAITRFSVRMKHDDRKQQAAVALSIVLVCDRRRLDGAAACHEAGGLGRRIGHHRRPRYRSDLREDQRAPLPRTQPDLRAAGSRQCRCARVGQGERDRQVSDRTDDRIPGAPDSLPITAERRIGMVGLRHRGHPRQRDRSPW